MLGVVIQNRYEISRHLRDDRLGSIYKGFDKKLDKSVAINILKENPGEELEVLMERVHFLYGLNHKNIVKFYDSGQEHKFYYLIYEYIDGFSLKDFISQYELKDPVYYAVYLCSQICEALYYSHNNYIFHGDLNLDNILIASNGEIKLNNFGLMRLEPDLENETDDNIFFSPEQINSEEVDARTDIYSLGSILYYLVSGQSVYSQIGKNFDKTINPPGKYNPSIPRPLENIIMKMLGKTPVERYQFVGKILNELSGIKYKSLKPLVQELFPQTDFSKFLSEKPVVTTPLQLKTVGEQQSDGKMKLDFRLLDVICQATGVRYKEARDAIIEAEGDVAAAIAIVRRKGEGSLPSPGEGGIEIKPVAEEPVEGKQGDIFSRLLFGYFIISNEKGYILFYFPSILLFSLLAIPFLFMLSPVIAIIVIVILVLGFLSPFFANLQPDIIDKDTFEFRRRVQMTLTHIATQELSSTPSMGPESIFMQGGFPSPSADAGGVTVAPSKEKVSPVRRSEQKTSEKEEKPVPSKSEKIPEAKDDLQEKIEHICSRVEGVTPDEARRALDEVDGDQTKAVMNLRRMKRQSAKAPPPEPPPPAREEKPPPREEKPPPREEKPPPREEKPPPREEKPPAKPASGGKSFDPEKIDYVCRRTKVSEDEAIKALEENNGDEIEAVMSIKKKRRRRRE